MSDPQLQQLAQTAGLAVNWVDADGQPQQVSPEVLRSVLAGLHLPSDSAAQIQSSLAQLTAQKQSAEVPPLLTVDAEQAVDLRRYFAPNTAYELEDEDGRLHSGRLDDNAQLLAPAAPGYLKLQIAGQQLRLAVAPARCYRVQDLTGTGNPRLWGLGVQLYSLRRQGDGGLGDLAELESLIHSAAEQGADAVAISPVHAILSAEVQHYSPYSPSSRVLYNVLHSAPAQILSDRELRQAIEASGVGPQMAHLEQLEFIDWPTAAKTKLQMLRALHAAFRVGGHPQHEDFHSFRRQAGDALENHCRFEAVHGWRLAQGESGDWRQWPEALRNPDSPELQRFAGEHAEEVEFHAFGQWLMDRGLHRCQTAARAAGMGIGLISDLAVGADGAGSQAWSRQAELLANLSVGAPPDLLNRSGQAWGISAFSPEGLRRYGFRAFIEMLQANLAHAGGIRIDHVMGLQRLWVIPPGAEPKDGAYLHYPQEDLLRLLALESWRHHAIILGEDLGTVPAGFREQLAARGILGMRVLLFEQTEQGFIPPKAWPETALATTTTHDLPTISGWLNGRDLDWRMRQGELEASAHVLQYQARQRERAQLEKALALDSNLPDSPTSDALLNASLAYIGHTPAPLVLLPLEDALASEEQPNLPGGPSLHPNWRRRWPVSSAQLLQDAAVQGRLQLLAQARRAAEERHYE
jgi:4-alpha-glucanotransferase